MEHTRIRACAYAEACPRPGLEPVGEQTSQGILSPWRLPIPPLRLCLCSNKLHERLRERKGVFVVSICSIWKYTHSKLWATGRVFSGLLRVSGGSPHFPMDVLQFLEG